MWSKNILLLLLLALCLVPLSAEDSYIDQALYELQKLENSLSQLTEYNESLQDSLSREKLWSLSLQRTIEALQSQSIIDKELLMQQETSLNQANQALQKLERSLNLSRIVNIITIPVAVISTTAFVIILSQAVK